MRRYILPPPYPAMVVFPLIKQILELRLNFVIIGLEVCRSVSVKCIWEIPNKQ
jgi:hypothetical protein